MYKIIVEETQIIKVYLLFRKKEIFPYTSIKNSNLEFIHGANTEAGRINPGYYRCIFTLKNGEKLIITPLYYENYKQLIRVIGENRNK